MLEDLHVYEVFDLLTPGGSDRGVSLGRLVSVGHATAGTFLLAG